jgi:hypothetical protein
MPSRIFRKRLRDRNQLCLSEPDRANTALVGVSRCRTDGLYRFAWSHNDPACARDHNRFDIGRQFVADRRRLSTFSFLRGDAKTAVSAVAGPTENRRFGK